MMTTTAPRAAPTGIPCDEIVVALGWPGGTDVMEPQGRPFG